MHTSLLITLQRVASPAIKKRLAVQSTPVLLFVKFTTDSALSPSIPMAASKASLLHKSQYTLSGILLSSEWQSSLLKICQRLRAKNILWI